MTFLDHDNQLPMISASLPAPLQTMLKSCFADLKERPTADEVVAVLEASHLLSNLLMSGRCDTWHVHVKHVADHAAFGVRACSMQPVSAAAAAFVLSSRW